MRLSVFYILFILLLHHLGECNVLLRVKMIDYFACFYDIALAIFPSIFVIQTVTGKQWEFIYFCI